MQFDLHVRTPTPALQLLEPDLARAQRDISWAEHLVLVYPTWWGTFPALLKGFLDRVLTPDFAFRPHTVDNWDRLLAGRTADLITTMDTPPLVYRLVYRAPGRQALARATLGYCGVDTVHTLACGPVMASDVRQRTRWLEEAQASGARLRHGARSLPQRLGKSMGNWLVALRLQFYPMIWIAYTVGALLARRGGRLSVSAYVWGYLVLFLVEAATVFLNDWFDLESDRRNRNAGRFNGGSRVLVDARLSLSAMRQGIGLALFAAGAAFVGLLAAAPAASVPAIGVLYVVMGLLALGYTVPPFKFSHRGWGELDVMLTNSLGAVLAGYVVQGGVWTDGLPWLLSLPLGLSILPGILLANCPDRDADKATNKRTLVVILGKRGSARLAMAASIAAPAVAVLLTLVRPDVATLLGWSAFAGAVHGVFLYWHLRRFMYTPMPERIDASIVLALTFILWFCVPPLLTLALA